VANPTFGQRLRLAAAAATAIMSSRNVKAPRSSGAGGPYVLPETRKDRPQPHPIDYNTYAYEAFARNAIVNSGISYKVRTMTSAPLRAYTGTPKNPTPLPVDDPLQQLCLRPNPSQSWEEMMGYLIVSLNLDGNAYVHIEREEEAKEGDVPVGLYPLRPDKVFIVPKSDTLGKQGVVGYVYVPEGRNAYDVLSKDDRKDKLDDGSVVLYEPDDIVHVKFPNPLDELDGMGYGMSPMSPLANTVAVDNQLTSFVRDYIERGGIPPFWFTYENALDPSDVAKLREYVQTIYGGSKNWLRPGVLDKGGKVERIGLTMDELGFESLDSRDECRLLSTIGVPPMVVGTRVGLERSTYENYENARRAFWQDTMWPELRQFEVEFQHYLNNGDVFVQFDLTDVPAIAQDINAQFDAAHKAWQMGTPADIAFDAVGLHLSDVTGGDIGYVPVNMYPVNAKIDASQQDGPPSAPAQTIVPANKVVDGAKSLKGTKVIHIPLALKEAQGRRVDRIARGWEAKFRTLSAYLLDRDMGAILALLSDAGRKALQDRTTVNWTQVERDIMVEMVASKKHWREAMIPLLAGIMEDQQEQWAADMGIDMQDVGPLLASDWFSDYSYKMVTWINDTTAKGLRQVTRAAVAGGWSAEKATAAAEVLFEQYIKGNVDADEMPWWEGPMPGPRVDVIAVTESMRASNAAIFLGMRQSGMQTKEWIAVGDEKTRPDHMEAFSTYTEGGAIGPIPMDQPFIVGGAPMMYPLDPSGPASQVNNCRCTLFSTNPRW